MLRCGKEDGRASVRGCAIVQLNSGLDSNMSMTETLSGLGILEIKN